MRTVRGSESPLQLRTRTVRRPDACGRGLSADVKFVDPHTSENNTSQLKQILITIRNWATYTASQYVTGTQWASVTGTLPGVSFRLFRETTSWPPSWKYDVISKIPPSVYAYLLQWQSGQISSSYNVKWRSIKRLLWIESPNKNNKMNSDMWSVPDPYVNVNSTTMHSLLHNDTLLFFTLINVIQ